MSSKKNLVLIVILCIGISAMAQSPETNQNTEVHSFSYPVFGKSLNHQLRLGIGAKLFEPARFMIFEQEPVVIDTDNSELGIKTNYNFHEGARNTTGALFGEYIVSLNKTFELGATFTYFSYYSNYYSNYSSNQNNYNAQVGENEEHHFSIYPTLRLNYVNQRNFRIYSALALGPRFVFEHDNSPINKSSSSSVRVAGQMTLLGFSIGVKNFWFVDLCTLGTQGFITTGIGLSL
jgi:hypothetical protein